MSERDDYPAGVPCSVETLQYDQPPIRTAVLADPRGATVSIRQLVGPPA